MRTKIAITLFFFLFLLFFSDLVRGGNEILSRSLRGNQICVNNTCKLSPSIQYLYSGWQMLSSRFEVRLYLAEDRPIVRHSDISYQVSYQLILSYMNGFQDTLTESLSVHYLKGDSYTDVSVSVHDHCYSAVLKVLSVSGSPVLPEDLVLENRLEITRRSIADTLAVVSSVGGVYQSAKEELLLSWSYLEGAESYDVEFLFVDNPGNRSDLCYDFRNSTRVNVSTTYYAISLSYPAGNLLYRVRGVGLYDSLNLPVYGKWSGNFAEQGFSLPALDVSRHYRYEGLEESLTWQYTAVYSESGKRKESLTFFDGSFRNRQQVTLSNNSQSAVVGETFYDHVGRQALQSIPSATANRGLRYYGAHGTSDGLYNGSFEKDSYDTDSTLTHGVPYASPYSGSACYYSAFTPFRNKIYHAVNILQTPVGAGYTYSHTRYVNDGTDRIHSESVPGMAFSMGSGRERKYYYGNPMQAELDRLFGNEVGYAGHYQKVMIVDANGVVSSSYYDMQERLIATAIGGGSGSNLLPIDNAPVAATLSNVIVFDQSTRDYVENITVGVPTNYSFSYDFKVAPPLKDTCGLIYGINSRYKLVMSLWSPDAQQYLFRDSLSTQRDTVLSRSRLLLPGSYQLYKHVEVLTDSLFDSEMSAYAWRQRPCVDYERAEVTRCYSVCEEHCMLECDLIVPDSSSLVYMQCLYDCENPPQTLDSECDAKLAALLADMSPGGQYFDNIRTCCPDDTCNYSVDSNVFLRSICRDFFRYDADMMAILNSFGYTDFDDTFWNHMRTYWVESYGQVLLKYHPEYPLYKFLCDCGNHNGQHEFDSLLWNTRFYDQAKNNGLFNLLGLAKSDHGISKDLGLGYQPFENSLIDPSFRLENNCCDHPESMIDYIRTRLTNYIEWTDGSSTFYISVYYLLFDPEHIAGGGYIPDSDLLYDAMVSMQKEVIPAWMSGYQCSADDARWLLFKSIYYYLREEAKRRYLGNCVKENCYDPPFKWGQQAWWSDHYPLTLLDCCDHFLSADPACPSVPLTMVDSILSKQGNFQVRFMCNPTYNITIENLDAVRDMGLDQAYKDCCQNCETYANGWMAELEGYFQSHCSYILSDPDSTWWYKIRNDLVYLCQTGCNKNFINRDFSVKQLLDLDTYSSILSSFCNVKQEDYPRIVYPHPSGNETDCGCNQYEFFLSEGGLTFWSDVERIYFLLNQQGISISKDTISEWNHYCIWTRYSNLLSGNNDTTELYGYRFPEAFRCDFSQADAYAECRRLALLDAASRDTVSFYQALDSLVMSHRDLYQSHCLSGLSERLTVSCSNGEILYTLYYYDQANNLIKTVSPKGVRFLSNAQLVRVQAYRDTVSSYQKLFPGFIHPSHTMLTNYRYNSLNQVTQSYQPDHDDISEIYYDLLSRPVLSQNSQQRSLKSSLQKQVFNYTQYDALGRIEEVGEIYGSLTFTRDSAAQPAALRDFIVNGTKKEVVRSFYDKGLLSSLTQRNLRNRLSSVTRQELYHADSLVYNSATHYSYDIHGNVEKLVQNIPDLGLF
ncbi:MAG: hypothetical protein RR382_06855, partial [Tannerellaceae bacterium]